MDHFNIPDIQKIARTANPPRRFIIDAIKYWNKKHLVNPTKKIAFIGDSYCADFNSHREDNNWPSWPEMVAKYFNAEIIQLGFAGLPFISSFYNAYIKHEKNSVLEKADIIIVCVSAPDRLPTRTAYPLNSAFLVVDHDEINNNWVPKQVIDAGKAYYEHLFLGNFHYIAQKGAIRELDDIIVNNEKGHGKIIIWLPCFKDSLSDYVPKSGVTGDIELFEVFKHDSEILHPNTSTEHKLKYGFEEGPNMCNHMRKKSNDMLATHLIRYIENKGYCNQIPVTDLLKVYT